MKRAAPGGTSEAGKAVQAPALLPPLPGPLFAPPGKSLLLDLDRALAGAARLFPVPPGRRADLPRAVRELSRLLTEERGLLSRPYWSSARFAAAYLHYFLPWNLYRLAWLLPGLDLPLSPGAQLLDIGSGPLTLPLALWLARPDLRGLELEIICSDVSPAIMERGKSLFEHLAGPRSPWRIRLERGAVDHVLGRHRGRGLAAILAGNALNEICTRPGGRDKAAPLAARLGGLMAAMRACLAPGGRLLLLEPGTRLGGKLITQAREGALSHGFAALAPCTHAAPCPLAGHRRGQGLDGDADPAPHSGFGPATAPVSMRGRGASPATGPNRAVTRSGQADNEAGAATGWCHFILPATDAPAKLQGLSAKAGLEKETLSLAFALLAAGESDAATAALPDDQDLDDLESLYLEIMAEDAQPKSARPGPLPKNAKGAQAGAQPGGRDAAAGPVRPGPDDNWQGLCRVVSQAIRLAGRAEPGRYVCCELGLGMLLGGPNPASGAELYAHRLAGDGRDAKSGAALLRPGRIQTRAKPGTTGAGRQRPAPRRDDGDLVQGKEAPRTGGGAKHEGRAGQRRDGAGPRQNRARAGTGDAQTLPGAHAPRRAGPESGTEQRGQGKSKQDKSGQGKDAPGKNKARGPKPQRQTKRGSGGQDKGRE